jgi:hypothetical protein
MVLSADELAMIGRAADKDRAFLESWTRKEAFAKLDGRGLGRYLATITLSGPTAALPDLGVSIADLAIGGAVGAVAAHSAPTNGGRLQRLRGKR